MKISNLTNLNKFKINNSTQSKKINTTNNISRVEEIKEKIKNNEYKLDIKKTAKAMAEYLK